MEIIIKSQHKWLTEETRKNNAAQNKQNSNNKDISRSF